MKCYLDNMKALSINEQVIDKEVVKTILTKYILDILAGLKKDATKEINQEVDKILAKVTESDVLLIFNQTDSNQMELMIKHVIGKHIHF